jgi:hypothetical protein
MASAFNTRFSGSRAFSVPKRGACSKALGLTVPLPLLGRADEVIE